MYSEGGAVQSRNHAGDEMSVAMNFPLMMPADGFVTRQFDQEEFHYGVDFAGKQGTPIMAAASGTVVFAGWTYDDGYMMIIAHGGGFVTVYKHNKALFKDSGMNVKRGETIALLGNTGRTSSGPHLHFEVWKDGNVLNPSNYLLLTQ